MLSQLRNYTSRVRKINLPIATRNFASESTGGFNMMLNNEQKQLQVGRNIFNFFNFSD